MTGAMLRLKMIGVVLGVLLTSNLARAEDVNVRGTNGETCATSLATPRALTLPDRNVRYPRYSPIDQETVLAEDLTSVLDVIADVHINFLVRRRVLPATVHSALGSDSNVPPEILALLDLDPSAVPRLRVIRGRTEFGDRDVIVTDLDGELKTFYKPKDLMVLGHTLLPGKYKEFIPSKKTFLRLDNGRVARISKSNYQINARTGKTVRRVELLPKDYESAVSDIRHPNKSDLEWMVNAGLFTPLEWQFVSVGHGRRKGFINEDVPVIVFDIAGKYLEITEQFHDVLYSEHARAEKWPAYMLHRAWALREPRMNRPIRMRNGKLLLAHKIPHPSDPLYRLRAVEVIKAPVKAEAAEH